MTRTDPSTGCQEWIGTRRNGYGRFSYSGKTHSAHRFSWELKNGVIPDGLFVCHRCDNPACVNLDHLFLGSRADNMQDMWNKHRHPLPVGGRCLSLCGEGNSHAKLSIEDVYVIRELASAGQSPAEISLRFPKIQKPAIWKIIHRVTWKHV